MRRTTSHLLQLFFLFYFSIQCITGTLWKREVHRAISRKAVCNDFTPASFYIRKQSSIHWIIHLESGGACSSISECNDRYLIDEDGYNTTNELMTSSQLPPSATGRDLLSADKEENPTFHGFTHVMIPYCSSDLWLGQGNHSRFPEEKFKFHNNSNVNDFIFRGYTIFHSVIEDLLLNGLVNATNVVLVGSSAGGIGVLNHLQYVQSLLPAATVSAIIDSSWFIDFDNYLTDRFNAEAAELSQYDLLPACQDNTQGYPCCASTQCMLRSHFKLGDALFSPSTPIFNIVSLYDLYILSESIKRLADNDAGLFDYTKTVFLYGGAINESLRNVVRSNNVSLFMPSCTQHVYFATTSLWDVGQLFNRSVTHNYSKGTVYFSHTIRSQNWRRTLINGISLQQAISSWYDSNYTVNDQLYDTCSGVICNPTCPDQVTFSVADTTWSNASKAIVIAAAIAISVSCVSFKLIILFYQHWVTSYFNQCLTAKTDSKLCLPDCLTGNQMNISCINLSYSLPKKSSHRQITTNRRPANDNPHKVINNVSTYFNPGELVAVMGPSGCGKTTLLDVLVGRRSDGTNKGEVLVNGLPKESATNFNKYTGYVLQLATPFYEDLTVSENLLYSSVLRLPKHMSWNDRIERVLQVMGETGLTGLSNTRVGGSRGPGLSGGQKRRLSVAIQLLSMPRILFLDEPTSGLDASSSLNLLQMLHCLALSGRSVILTIHQPRLEIYHMFDKILFLCKGQVAYFGSPFKAPSFFSEAVEESGLKLTITEMNNPADTIMDILTNIKAQEEIICYYKSSGNAEAVCEAIKNMKTNTDKNQFESGNNNPGFFLRLFCLESRASARQTNTKVVYLPILFLLLGLLLGSTFWNSSDGFMVMSVYCIISCSSALFISSVVMGLLVRPLQIFAVEHQDGISKAIDIILQVFIRVSALSIFPVTIGVFITYIFVTYELRYNWSNFVSILLIQFLVNHAWISIFILAVSCNPAMAYRICPLISALAGFASGFIIAPPTMPIYYRWLFPINPTYWGYTATVKILLNDVDFECEYESKLECFPFSGLYSLELFGLQNTDPYLSIAVLMGILAASLILSLIILEIKYTPHLTKALSNKLLKKTKSQIHSWPISPNPTTASQQPTPCDKHNGKGEAESNKIRNERYGPPLWAWQSQSQQSSTISALLDNETEEHEVKDNQTLADRWEISKSITDTTASHGSHEESPETDIELPAGITSDELPDQAEILTIHSLMDSRTARSKYILEERKKKMQEHIQMLSNSLSAWFYARKWKKSSQRNQRKRKWKHFHSTIPDSSPPTEKCRLSIGDTQPFPTSLRHKSTFSERHFNSNFKSTNQKPLHTWEPAENQHHSDACDLTNSEDHTHGKSSQNKCAPSSLIAWPQIIGNSNKIDRTEEQPENETTSFVSCPLPPPPRLPPLTLTRRHSSVPEELDKLWKTLQSDPKMPHKYSNQSKSSLKSGKR